MLQHRPEESQEQDVSTPPTQIRVTAEELAAAINALEASKDEAARHLAGTVPIGQVIEELKLEASPEEIWAQVQKQRAQIAQEEAARLRPVAVQSVPVTLKRSTARRIVRGLRGIKTWVWILFWCGGGGTLFSAIPHLLHSTSSSIGVHIGSNYQTLTSGTLGQDVEVSGDQDKITLQGDCPTLTITGDGNHIRVEGSVRRVIADGDGNTVVYTRGGAPALSGNGDGNQVGPTAP